MTDGAKLIDDVKQLTGLTDHALARKLAVSVDDVRQGCLNPQALEALEAFRKTSLSRGLCAPRTKSPEATEGAWLGDCLELMRTVPDASVDAIISDIPYGIGLEDWDVLHDNTNSALLGASDAQRRAGGIFKRRHKPINGWSDADRTIPLQYYKWCASWAPDWLRVLKPGGSAMVFAGRRLAHRCTTALEDNGFNFRDMLAWTKSRAPFRAQRLSTVLKKRGEAAEAKRWEGWRVGSLAPRFEPILWLFKPYDVTLVDNVLDHMVGALNAESYKGRTGNYDNTIYAAFEPGEGGLHEAQKPVALLQTLIELCVPPGGLVLDPFAGSGSTAVAAIRSRCRHIVFEKDPKHFDTLKARLAQVEGPND